MRSLPFQKNTADGIIMIAALHHLPPKEQHKALFEIQRVLKPGGKALITNWAVEQPTNSRRKFEPGLNYVIWKGKEENPLPYWIMNKAMAVEFIYNLPTNLKCINFELVEGNWCFTLEKDVS